MGSNILIGFKEGLIEPLGWLDSRAKRGYKMNMKKDSVNKNMKTVLQKCRLSAHGNMLWNLEFSKIDNRRQEFPGGGRTAKPILIVGSLTDKKYMGKVPPLEDTKALGCLKA